MGGGLITVNVHLYVSASPLEIGTPVHVGVVNILIRVCHTSLSFKELEGQYIERLELSRLH